MNNNKLLKALSRLLIAGQNNYHLSYEDLTEADYAMQVLTNILKHVKKINKYEN